MIKKKIEVSTPVNKSPNESSESPIPKIGAAFPKIVIVMME